MANKINRWEMLKTFPEAAVVAVSRLWEKTQNCKISQKEYQEEIKKISGDFQISPKNLNEYIDWFGEEPVNKIIIFVRYERSWFDSPPLFDYRVDDQFLPRGVEVCGFMSWDAGYVLKIPHIPQKYETQAFKEIKALLAEALIELHDLDFDIEEFMKKGFSLPK